MHAGHDNIWNVNDKFITFCGKQVTVTTWSLLCYIIVVFCYFWPVSVRTSKSKRNCMRKFKLEKDCCGLLNKPQHQKKTNTFFHNIHCKNDFEITWFCWTTENKCLPCISLFRSLTEVFICWKYFISEFMSYVSKSTIVLHIVTRMWNMNVFQRMSVKCKNWWLVYIFILQNIHIYFYAILTSIFKIS